MAVRRKRRLFSLKRWLADHGAALTAVANSVALIALFWMLQQRHDRNPTTLVQSMQENEGHDFQLNTIINEVTEELEEGDENRRSKDRAELFQVKSFDLEVNFVVKAHRTESGKIEPQFVAVGTESQIAAERVQKITLHLSVPPPTRVKQPMDSATRGKPTGPLKATVQVGRTRRVIA